MPLSDNDKTPVDIAVCAIACGEKSTFAEGPMPHHPPAFCRHGTDWYYCSNYRYGWQRFVYSADFYDEIVLTESDWDDV